MTGDASDDVEKLISDFEKVIDHPKYGIKAESRRARRPGKITIAGLALLLTISTYWALTRDNPSSGTTPPTVACYHHTIQPEESLDDAVNFFRCADSAVNIDTVAEMNKLPEDRSVYVGQDIVYCHQIE